MCEPCNRIGFSASGGVLNQVAFARSVPCHICE
jgi:hypothetical protein